MVLPSCLFLDKYDYCSANLESLKYFQARWLAAILQYPSLHAPGSLDQKEAPLLVVEAEGHQGEGVEALRPLEGKIRWLHST